METLHPLMPFISENLYQKLSNSSLEELIYYGRGIQIKEWVLIEMSNWIWSYVYRRCKFSDKHTQRVGLRAI